MAGKSGFSFDLGSIAAGAIGRLLGGGGPDMTETNRQLRQSRQLTQMAIDLYNNTDLAATDAQAVAELQQNAGQDAMSALNNYDAMMAARGSSMFKGSTAKNQARTDIAYNAGRDSRSLASNLLTTRANRKAALLPNPSAPLQGMQGAMAMDQFANDQKAAQQNAIFNIAYGLMNSKNTKVGTPPIMPTYNPTPIQGGYNPSLDAMRKKMDQNFNLDQGMSDFRSRSGFGGG
jgi:hypothetical protein